MTTKRLSLADFDQDFLNSFHEEDSPYYGLCLQDQARLAKLRRGGVKPPKAVLRRLRPPAKEDYAKILVHCSKALLKAAEAYRDGERLDRVFVYVELYYNYRQYCHEGWPKGRSVAFDDWTVVNQYTADTLINYLHEVGHSHYTAKELRKELWAIRRETERLDWLDGYSVDICVQEAFEDIVQQAKTDPNRNRKARRVYRRRKVEAPQEIIVVGDENSLDKESSEEYNGSSGSET